MEIIKTTMIPLSDLQTNDGQIVGVPGNPRILIAEQFEWLKKSIEDNPEMLAVRELIVYKYGDVYVVIGGNMRLQAMRELGFKTAPCKVIPDGTSIDKLREYTIKDNVTFGEWSEEDLQHDWSEEPIEEWGAIALSNQEQDEEQKPSEDEFLSMHFVFTAEQFKHVKQTLNALDKDNGIAILKLLHYGE